MKRPDSKILGVITIDVYEGNQTFCSFKGDVPALVLQGVHVSLPRDYYYHLSDLSAANLAKVNEDKRVKLQKIAEDDRKNLETKQAEEKIALKKQQEIDQAASDLKVVKAIVITEFTQGELRRYDQQLKRAEEKLKKLQYVEPVPAKEEEAVEEK